jgi:hypothetical protein
LHSSAIAQQQKEIKALKAELKEQASQIQKVSAQLQLRKPEPQGYALQPSAAFHSSDASFRLDGR